MIRASAWESLNVMGEWLDPDLPPGQEFCDLMWRAAWLRKKAVVVPAAKVWVEHTPAVLEADSSVLEWKNDDVWLRCRHLPWILCRRWRSAFSRLLHPWKRVSTFKVERAERLFHKARLLRGGRLATREEMRKWFRAKPTG